MIHEALAVKLALFFVIQAEWWRHQGCARWFRTFSGTDGYWSVLAHSRRKPPAECAACRKGVLSGERCRSNQYWSEREAFCSWAGSCVRYRCGAVDEGTQQSWDGKGIADAIEDCGIIAWPLNRYRNIIMALLFNWIEESFICVIEFEYLGLWGEQLQIRRL